MKRERRHELQHNDLAEWILRTYERIVPYRNTILGVGLLAVVLIVALTLWRSHSVAVAGEAWNSLGIPVFQPQFADERAIGEMQKAAASHPGTAAAEWAVVFQGDAELVQGTNRILTEKKVGIEYLTRARDTYTKALETLTIPGAQEQAMFGKARALEALIQNKDQLDEAVAAYQKLNEKFPNGRFKAVADRQIERLQTKDALAFYEALSQYTPKPRIESPRQPGKSGPLLENPPDEPLVPSTPVRPAGSQSGPLGLPEPSLTPTEPAKPSTPKPDAPKPDVPKPDVPKADTTKTEPTKLKAAKPDALEPDAPKKDTPKPDAPKPDASKKDAPKTEPAKPQTVKPDDLKPDAPKKGSPQPDAPKNDTPKKDK